MWVSRKEWDAMKEQLAELNRRHDAHVIDVTACRNFTVYSHAHTEWVHTHYGSMYERRPSQDISVKDVVSRILERLGMELVYVAGTPAKVDTKKKEKANVRKA